MAVFLGALQLQLHSDVGDIGIHENFSQFMETKTPVKWNNLHLGIQPNLVKFRLRANQQQLKQRAAHPLPRHSGAQPYVCPSWVIRPHPTSPAALNARACWIDPAHPIDSV